MSKQHVIEDAIRDRAIALYATGKFKNHAAALIQAIADIRKDKPLKTADERRREIAQSN